MRHAASLIALCLLLSACGGREEEPAAPPAGDETAPEAVAEPAAGDEAGAEAGTLEWAVQGAWRGEQAARDEWRNPQETLEFFDIDPSGTVVEIWPAAGWYTQIVAPWIAANGGTYGLKSPTRAGVDEFHAQGIAMGGSDEGAPGPRDFAPNAYAAYMRDLDGNKICAVCFAEP